MMTETHAEHEARRMAFREAERLMRSRAVEYIPVPTEYEHARTFRTAFRRGFVMATKIRAPKLWRWYTGDAVGWSVDEARRTDGGTLPAHALDRLPRRRRTSARHRNLRRECHLRRRLDSA